MQNSAIDDLHLSWVSHDHFLIPIAKEAVLISRIFINNTRQVLVNVILEPDPLILRIFFVREKYYKGVLKDYKTRFYPDFVDENLFFLL